MDNKIILNGFLTEDVQLITGKNKNPDGRMTVCVNKENGIAEYFSVFEYNISERRAKNMKKGCFVQVIGILTLETYINPKVLDEFDNIKNINSRELAIKELNKYIHINRTVRAKDFEIIFIKK